MLWLLSAQPRASRNMRFRPTWMREGLVVGTGGSRRIKVIPGLSTCRDYSVKGERGCVRPEPM